VLPLSVPGPKRSPTATDLERSESARLFSERARQREPAVAFTDHNTQWVAAICKKLEGIPLAIELAAARVNPLCLGHILERLDGSFELLTLGGR
jgi:predicted ATPase